jgi:hypothetical protein
MVRKLIDIREQFPILPREDTLALADLMGIKHPPGVLTVDFMLTLQVEDGDIYYIARDVKELKELADTRVLEKLSLVLATLEIRGIDWGLVISDRDLPEACWRNVEWLRLARDIRKLPRMTRAEVRETAEVLSAEVVASGGTVVLNSLCSACDRRLKLKGGVCLKITRFLFANKVWRVDMTRRIVTNRPITIQIDGLEAFLEEQCPRHPSS